MSDYGAAFGFLLFLWFRLLSEAYEKVCCFIDDQDQDTDLTQVQQVLHIHTSHIIHTVVCHLFRSHHTIPR
jgi:hypothetical protein